MTTTTGVREGFSTVTPYVTAVDVDAMIAFAKDVFGAVETYRSSGSAGGTHCELRIGDSMVMFGGGGPAGGRTNPAALHVYVPDADAVYRRAIEAGARSMWEPKDQPYGERSGGVADAAGNQWYIATRLTPAHPAMRAVTPFLIRQGALGLIDFLKAAFGAEEIGVYKSPEGRLLHAAMKIGDAALEFGESEDYAGTMPSAFYLYVPDVDALYRQAVAAGAESMFEPRNEPYGDRVGGVKDAWGYTWYIATAIS
jgi:uncharacterized glyoxalase superfamily protein PhnB